MMAKTERCISMTFHAFDLNSLTGGNKQLLFSLSAVFLRKKSILELCNLVKYFSVTKYIAFINYKIRCIQEIGMSDQKVFRPLHCVSYGDQNLQKNSTKLGTPDKKREQYWHRQEITNRTGGRFKIFWREQFLNLFSGKMASKHPWFCRLCPPILCLMLRFLTYL